jgi:Ras-related protein Rab-11A
MTTTHVGYLTHSVDIDRTTTSFHLWDTAGQEKYKATTSLYCRGAHGALIVFDVTSRPSFAAIPSWMSLINPSDCPRAVPVVIAANKADLAPVISRDEMADFCSENGDIQYFETSALNGMGVDAAFETLCRLALEMGTPTIQEPPAVELERNKKRGEEGEAQREAGSRCC